MPPNWLSPAAAKLISKSELPDERIVNYLRKHYYRPRKQLGPADVEAALIEVELGADTDDWAEAQRKKREANERRAQAAAQRHVDRIWPQVERVVKRERCRCGLRPDMTLAELLAMKGCRDQPRVSPRYVCPALYTFRVLRGWGKP